MRFFLLFPLLAGLLSAQGGVSLQLKALQQPGVYSRASSLHYQERYIPSGPVQGTHFLSVQAAGNGGSAGSILWVKPRLQGPEPGCILEGRAWALQTLFVSVRVGTITQSRLPGPAKFQAVFTSPRDLEALLVVRFHGRVSSSNGMAAAVVGNWKKTSGIGSFSFQAELPLHLKKGIPSVVPFSLEDSVKSSSWVKNSCDAVLEIQLLPVLSFQPFGKSCAGRIGSAGPPRYGRDFRVTLTGGVSSAPCFLVAGNSNRKFLGISLPLDLGPLGAPGCFLYTSIVGAVPAKTSPAGNAGVTFHLPPSSWSLTFPDVFLQWIQASATNKLGVQTSDAAKLTAG